MTVLDPDKKSEIKSWLNTRLNEILEWYDECLVCEETRQNATRDVESILREMVKVFKLKPITFYPSLSFDKENKLVVRFIFKDLN